MGSKSAGPGFYEFLIEAELQQYYNAFKNELKVQNVAQLKYVSEDDMEGIGMSRPEIRRLTKFFHKHCPQTYLAKMKKKLLSRREDSTNSASLSSPSSSIPGRSVRSAAPGRHIIQASSIVSHKTLGSGEFGTVQAGVWTNDEGERIQVAIKSLSQDRMENNPVEFLKEAAMMHSVNHENIVRLYGVVLDTSSLVLVTELAPLRSLLECLKEPSMRPNLTVQTLFDFSFQICDAMQYLESKRLIHRDLAARNILVFSRSKVKISDFGLSRALGVGKDYYQTNFNVNLKLPIAWCAPECINFLRFTSSSDVWAFGVTIWEMYSYGFQPWAALTGQQILEAIDEPNYQRLERPECCPVEIYYQIMLKCWQHNPSDRPTFAQLLNLLPENKPEQVQAIRESESRSRRDVLSFDAGDLITVIDKKASQGNGGSGNSGDEATPFWKGVLKCGKTGLFNPAHTITYLGPSLPCAKESQGHFTRNDSRASIRKGRLNADMISSPQGETLKHTGHVGPDGQFFGDIAFMNSKCWVPRQVVPPYKPESPISREENSACSSPGSRFQFPLGKVQPAGDSHSETLSDTCHLLSQSQKSSDSSLQQKNRKKLVLPVTTATNGHSLPALDMEGDHEYHEISDEENEIMATSRGGPGAIGLSNPALSSKSQSPLDSPRFEKSFDLGPSLMDEVFGALEQERHNHHEFGDHESNVKNELREMSRQKKKFATVKPISSKDRKTLDHAIAITQELASRSMLELDRHGKHGRNSASFDDISSPRTPTSPTHRKKFSFLLGSSKNIERERRNYAQEAASIPDIQSTLSEEAKEAYNSLIEKPSSIGSLGFLTPSFENKSSSFHFPEKCSSKKSAFFDNEPLSPPPVFQAPAPRTSLPPPGNASNAVPTNSPGFVRSHTKSLSCTGAELAITGIQIDVEPEPEEEEEDGNPLRLLRKNKVPNVLPLPPRDRRKFTSSRSFDGSTPTPTASSASNSFTVQAAKTNHKTGSTGTGTGTRHQRKHPLLVPTKVSMPFPEPENAAVGTTGAAVPPPPPPKPQRQHRPSPPKQIAQPESKRGPTQPEINETECSNGTARLLLQTEDMPGIPEQFTPAGDNITQNEIVLGCAAPVALLSSSPPPSHAPSIPLYENYEDEAITNGVSFNQNDHGEAAPPVVLPVEPKQCWRTPELDVRSVDLKERRSHFEKEVNEALEVVSTSTQFNFRRTEIQSSRKQSAEVFTPETKVADTTTIVDTMPQPGVGQGDMSETATSVVPVGRGSEPRRKSEDRQLPAGPPSDPVMIRSETKGGFRCSPTKDAILYANPLKIKTVQRILGASATEKECIWALDICRDDCPHAVKLLRLKSLLPESLLQLDIERVVSVLEMSHWDICKASDFLLSSPINPNSKTRNSLRKFPKVEETNSNHQTGATKLGLDNGNVVRRDSATASIKSSGSSSGSLDVVNSNNVPAQRNGNGSSGRRSSSSSTTSSGPTPNTSSSSPSYIRPTRV